MFNNKSRLKTSFSERNNRIITEQKYKLWNRLSQASGWIPMKSSEKINNALILLILMAVLFYWLQCNLFTMVKWLVLNYGGKRFFKLLKQLMQNCLLAALTWKPCVASYANAESDVFLKIEPQPVYCTALTGHVHFIYFTCWIWSVVLPHMFQCELIKRWLFNLVYNCQSVKLHVVVSLDWYSSCCFWEGPCIQNTCQLTFACCFI